MERLNNPSRDETILSRLFATFVLFLSLIVLTGWSLRTESLTALIPGFVSMKANTALGFLFASIALRLSSTKHGSTSPLRKRLIFLLAGLICALGGLTALQYVLASDFGIDQFLFDEFPYPYRTSAPGRMSPQTAVSFLLMGCSLILLQCQRKRLRLIGQALSIMTLVNAVFSLIGFAYQTEILFLSPNVTQIAPHTALSFSLLNLGLLTLMRDVGPAHVVFSNKPGGYMARRLIVAVLVFIPLLGWFILNGIFHGHFQTSTATATLVLGCLIIFTPLILITASRQNTLAETTAKAQQLFRMLVEGTKDYAILYLDVHGRIQSWNSGAERLTGYSDLEAIGQHASLLTSPRNTALVQLDEELKQAESEGLFEDDRFCRRKDGTSFWSHISLTPLRDRQGQVIGFSKILQNISQQREHEIELARAKDLAEAANRAKTQFLANMSHEIRTPLGVVIGMTELLLEPSTSQTEKDQLLKTTHRNSLQLAKLIDEVLDLSKIEADALEIEHMKFSLSELLDQLSESMGFKARSKGLTFTIQTDSGCPDVIESDPTRLRQMLDNLIGNAIKFTASGSIHMTVRPLHSIEQGQDASLEFLIEDTGIGMSAAQIAKLFQPFSQADQTMARRFGGSGLGLAISRRIAQALGGDLTIVQSQPGNGSIFRLVIANGSRSLSRTTASLQQELPPENSSNQSESRPISLHGLKTLLIDDSTDNQIMISRFLRLAGAAVDLASTGFEGIEHVQRAPPDLILMDIQMPEMDGYETTALLRKTGFNKPIIALTAHALQTDKERALAAGFDGYLTKPLNRNILIATLSQYLETRTKTHETLVTSATPVNLEPPSL